MKKAISYTLLFLIFLSLAVACKKEENLPPGKLAKEDALTKTAVVYPHSEFFNKTAEHGKLYRQAPSSCQTCHGKNMEGGTTTINCSSCHEAYPHSDAFSKTPLHGEKFLQNKAQCLKCHGSDYKGGSTKASCLACHNYPHEKNWALASRHGVAVLGNNAKSDCLKCHQENAGHKVTCNSCHSTYPHSKDFAKKLHGKEFLQDKNQCTNCHGNDFAGRGTKASCLRCHNYPHERNWALPGKHGANFLLFQAKGQSTECMSCHEESTAAISTCKSCHSTYPHSKDFIKASLHGPKFLENKNQCIACHANDFLGGSTKASCFKCHNFPHEKNWALPQKHGADIKNLAQCLSCHQESSGAKKACNSCHESFPHSREFINSPLHGKKYLQDQGQCIKCHGNSSKLALEKKACQKCHNFPHERNWAQPGKHGAEFLESMTHASSASECLSCHQNNPDIVVTCNSCHETYPHSDQFSTTTLHGSLFLENKGQCIKCHGSDFSGGNTKTACLDCHNFPHEKNWSKPDLHGAVFNEISAREASIKDPTKRKLTECMMCHQNKVDPTGTFKERHPAHFVACSSCHADLPHGAKFLPFKAGQAASVSHATYASAFPEIRGSCFSCHLNINRSAPKPVDSCMDCHEGVPWPWEVPIEGEEALYSAPLVPWQVRQ